MSPLVQKLMVICVLEATVQVRPLMLYRMPSVAPKARVVMWYRMKSLVPKVLVACVTRSYSPREGSDTVQNVSLGLTVMVVTW